MLLEKIFQYLKDVDIIILNTTIIVTKYILFPNSYNKLHTSYSSKLIFETIDTKLYIKDTIIIEGEIITTTNSEVINADIMEIYFNINIKYLGIILKYNKW